MSAVISWDSGLDTAPGDPGTLTKCLYSVSVLIQSSQHGGSSTSLASTKVCSSMDENDGPGEAGELGS